MFDKITLITFFGNVFPYIFLCVCLKKLSHFWGVACWGNSSSKAFLINLCLWNFLIHLAKEMEGWMQHSSKRARCICFLWLLPRLSTPWGSVSQVKQQLLGTSKIFTLDICNLYLLYTKSQISSDLRVTRVWGY